MIHANLVFLSKIYKLFVQKYKMFGKKPKMSFDPNEHPLFDNPIGAIKRNHEKLGESCYARQEILIRNNFKS